MSRVSLARLWTHRDRTRDRWPHSATTCADAKPAYSRILPPLEGSSDGRRLDAVLPSLTGPEKVFLFRASESQRH